MTDEMEGRAEIYKELKHDHIEFEVFMPSHIY